MIAAPATATGAAGLLLQAAVLLGGLAATLGWMAARASTVPERRLLRQQTGRDALTGLANRAGLAQAVADIAVSVPGGEPIALVIDLDGFKRTNDRYGHAAGDAVLVRAAQRLRSCLGDIGLRVVSVARLGGDEFAVLLVASDGTGPEAAGRIAAAVHRTLCRPYPCGPEGAPRTGVTIGASIGVAVGPTGLVGRDWDRLLRAADSAMYVAKRSGGGWTWAGGVAVASRPGSRPAISAVSASGPLVGVVGDAGSAGTIDGLPPCAGSFRRCDQQVRRLITGRAAGAGSTGRQIAALIGEQWEVGRDGGDLVA